MNFELLKKENILHDYEQIRLRNKRLLQESISNGKVSYLISHLRRKKR